MKCPGCAADHMVPEELDAGLSALHCPQCSGHWLSSDSYWKWREQHGENLTEEMAGDDAAPLPINESDRGKICPECRHILVKYKVGHDLAFSLERCGNCGGMWFDRYEWEALKSRNLHDDVHFIFSQPWQAGVAKAQRQKNREAFLLEKFGEQDLAEIRRIKAWLDAHPQKPALQAFLLNQET